MTHPWFRLYSRLITDPKIEMLSFEDQRHFVWLLCMKNDGYLDEEFPRMEMFDRMIGRKLGLQGEALDSAKRRLTEVGLIDDQWQPVRWDALQFSSDHDQQAAVRKRNQRERERLGIDVLMREQHNKCKCCEAPFSAPYQTSVVMDHDHETGENRGLLCQSCNKLVGQYENGKTIKDNIKLQLIERYLGGDNKRKKPDVTDVSRTSHGRVTDTSPRTDTDTDTDTDTEEKINTLLVGSESRPRPVEEKKPPRKTRKLSSDQPLAPEQFKTAWESYPKRAGDNPKADAVRAWNARIRDGTDPKTMVDGTRRYLSFCLATRKVGTETVKHAATFFGPNRSFEDPWIIPPPTNTRRAADNSSVAAEVVRRFNAKHGIVATDSDKPFIDGVCYAEK